MSDKGELETAIGVISGTSMDGIDVALIESDGEAQLKTGPSATFPYPPEVSERLRAVVADLSEAEAPQLELERLVTDAHVAAVEAFLDRYSIPRDRVSLVGLHGQTILHRPREGLDPTALRWRARPPRRSGSTSCRTFVPRMLRPEAKARPSRPFITQRNGGRPRAAADDPQLGRRRQRHLSWA